MRLFVVSLSFALLAACSQGTPIKDLPDKDVTTPPRQWQDPGAEPDLPVDAGAQAESDAGEGPESVENRGSRFSAP